MHCSKYIVGKSGMELPPYNYNSQIILLMHNTNDEECLGAWPLRLFGVFTVCEKSHRAASSKEHCHIYGIGLPAKLASSSIAARVVRRGQVK